MLYCGMDLHAKESFVHVIDGKGNRVLARRLPTDPRAFKEVLGPLVRRKVRVILEASTMSRWAAAELKKLKMEVVVVDPRRVRLIAETRRKSDRADARVLAELARTGALPPPLNLLSDEARQLQAQLGVRRGLIKQRTATVCQARALLRSVGIRLKRRGEIACNPYAYRGSALGNVPLCSQVPSTSKMRSPRLPETAVQLLRVSSVSFPISSNHAVSEECTTGS